MFFTGYVQGGLNASTTEQFNRQVEHIAYIVKETLERGGSVVEPSQEAQDAYTRHFREIEIDTSPLLSECTPSYYNNEGEERPAMAAVARLWAWLGCVPEAAGRLADKGRLGWLGLEIRP